MSPQRFGEEPPGPGRWERSEAYGWVPAEATVAAAAFEEFRRVWSEQFRTMVEVDADGRVIPPTD